MPDVPTTDRLLRSLMQARKDFSGRHSIVSIDLKLMTNRQPVIVIQATMATPPSGFPTAMSLKLDKGAPFLLPIHWRYVGKKGNEEMWGGATPVTNRLVTETYPGASQTPLLQSGQKDPEAKEDEYQLSIPARLPQFVLPNYWAKPFDVEGSVCIPFYETRYVAYSFKVPATSMVIVNGISYQFSNSITLLEQFTIEIARDLDSLCTFYDLMASNAVDPAEQYGFAGHYRPAPLYCRFDHDEQIIVRVKVRGLYPFTHTGADPLGGCFTVMLHGWMSSLMDERDGGARPIDMGEFNDIALGDG